MMNRGISIIIVLMALVCALPAQNEPQEPKLREYVQVVNVELTVRVIKDGQARGDFIKEDFRLLENGKECPINGFFETRRKMAPPASIPSDVSVPNPAERPGRLFLLLFWFNPDGSDLQPKLDYFFNQLYQPNDRVVLSTNRQSFEIRRPEDRPGVMKAFHQHWKDLGIRVQQDRRGTLTEIKNMVEDALDSLRSLDLESSDPIIAGINKAQAATILQGLPISYRQSILQWQLFNDRLDTNRLEAMARELEQIQADKWALVFYERDNLPLLDATALKDELSSATRDLLEKGVSECIKQIRVVTFQAQSGGGFSSLYQAMRPRFAQAGAVFHLLQLSPKTSREFDQNIMSTSAAIRMEPVFSNWDAVFQTISRASGGQIVDGEKGLAVLDRLAKLEDISYTLTYVPREKKRKNRRIELKIVNPDKKEWQKHLLYGRRLEMETVPELKVVQIRSDESRMQVQLESFYPVLTSSGPKGHFNVSLAAERSGQGPARVLYQQDIESDGLIEIPLTIHDPGDWTLWLRVVDRMSGQSVLEKRKIMRLAKEEAPPALPPPSEKATDELTALLIKAAAYSERLKRTALRFTCSEEILEQTRDRRSSTNFPRYNRKSWLHDYQIVVDGGSLTENRLLMKKDRQKFSPPKKAKLETFYESQYSFFLPATMLARERQGEYEYSLSGRDRIKKRDMIRVTAHPRKATDDLPGGELWIDALDGSVWRIVLDARTIPGFRPRYDSAQNRGIHLIMSDVHEYGERFQGIRFPTDTQITENHTYTRVYEEYTAIRGDGFEVSAIKQPRLAPPIQMEVLRVNYRYKSYRFFDVSSREEVQGWEEE